MRFGWIIGLVLFTAPLRAATLEVDLPSYVEHIRAKDRHFTRGSFGLHLTGITQWASVQGVRLTENQVVLSHLSSYVHARRAEVFQTGERLSVSRSRKWWVPLPRFDWKPFRRVWVSAEKFGVHLRLKRPIRAKLDRPIELTLVQTNKGFRTRVRNPERLQALLEAQLDFLVTPANFETYFEVDVYGFRYPANSVIQGGWKRVQGPLLSLARRQIRENWIPRVLESVTRK